MENAGYSKVRLESPKVSSKKGIGILSAVFVVSLVVCLAVGGKGPQVFKKNHAELQTDNLNVTWYGFIDEMHETHQLLYLHMRLRNPTPAASSLSFSQDYQISSWGTEKVFSNPICPFGCSDCKQWASKGQCHELTVAASTQRVISCGANQEWCDWTVLLTQDFVQYSTYYMKVDMNEPGLFNDVFLFDLEFEIVFISEAFTTFEMVFFYLAQAVVLCFMFLPRIGFFTEMRKVHQNFWSRQQLWVGLLLCSLLLFNNPFFAAQIYSPHPRFFFNLYVIFLAGFFALILFFWLEIFGDMAAGDMQGTDAAQERKRNRKKAFKEVLPKFVLIGLIFLTIALIYTYVRVKQAGDPSYSTVDDLSTYTGVKVLGALLATVYFGWLLYYIVLTFRHLRSLIPAYRFILGITLVAVVGTVVGIYMGALAPNQHGALALAGFMGLYNTYVLLLAWCYTPVGAQYGNVSDVEMVTADTASAAGDHGPPEGAFTITDDDQDVI